MAFIGAKMHACPRHQRARPYAAGSGELSQSILVRMPEDPRRFLAAELWGRRRAFVGAGRKRIKRASAFAALEWPKRIDIGLPRLSRKTQRTRSRYNRVLCLCLVSTHETASYDIVPFSSYIRSSAPILFLQEQIKDIIISNTRRSINRTHLCRLRHTYGGDALRLELVRQVRDQKRLSLQRLQTHVHTHSFTSYVHMYITGCTVLPRDTGSRGSAQQHSRRKDGGERESLTNRYLIHIVAHEIVDLHDGLNSRVL